MKTKNSFSVTDGRKILLIGDIDRAFSDADAVRQLPCEIQSNIPDAVNLAEKENFAAIGVVMFGSAIRLPWALEALRKANSSAKIILLAQMCEEPIAMKMVGTNFSAKALADDYLICPIQANRFYQTIELLIHRKRAELAAPAVDISSEMKIKQLEKLATEDDLTGLKNRRYIWEFSRQIIDYARKGKGQVTLLIFDIDNFKHYNDVYGHSAGDKVLKQAAVLMRRCCRGHDIVGRIGGDEFAVVFWDVTQNKTLKEKSERRSATAGHPKEAIFIAKRFIRELENAELHLLGPKGKGVLTISGGLATFPLDGSTMQELFNKADKALLDAKRSGKNRIYLVGKPRSDISDVK